MNVSTSESSSDESANGTSNIRNNGTTTSSDTSSSGTTSISNNAESTDGVKTGDILLIGFGITMVLALSGITIVLVIQKKKSF